MLLWLVVGWPAGGALSRPLGMWTGVGGVLEHWGGIAKNAQCGDDGLCQQRGLSRGSTQAHPGLL